MLPDALQASLARLPRPLVLLVLLVRSQQLPPAPLRLSPCCCRQWCGACCVACTQTNWHVCAHTHWHTHSHTHRSAWAPRWWQAPGPGRGGGQVWRLGCQAHAAERRCCGGSRAAVMSAATVASQQLQRARPGAEIPVINMFVKGSVRPRDRGPRFPRAWGVCCSATSSVREHLHGEHCVREPVTSSRRGVEAAWVPDPLNDHAHRGGFSV